MSYLPLLQSEDPFELSCLLFTLRSSKVTRVALNGIAKMVKVKAGRREEKENAKNSSSIHLNTVYNTHDSTVPIVWLGAAGTKLPNESVNIFHCKAHRTPPPFHH
jgi:hypothetical protein